MTRLQQTSVSRDEVERRGQELPPAAIQSAVLPRGAEHQTSIVFVMKSATIH